MNIIWAGAACFKIESSLVSLIIDPFFPESGLNLSQKKADIVLSSCANQFHGNVSAIRGRELPIIITQPGEYEIKDVFIYGIPVRFEKKSKSECQETIIFRIEIEGVVFVHLGALCELLRNGQLEHLDKTDVLFIPVGGGEYLNAESASTLIRQINPKIIIPMCYKIPGIKAQLEGVEKFYKEMGMRPAEILPKLKIAKKDTTTEEMKIITLGVQ